MLSVIGFMVFMISQVLSSLLILKVLLIIIFVLMLGTIFVYANNYNRLKVLPEIINFQSDVMIIQYPFNDKPLEIKYSNILGISDRYHREITQQIGNNKIPSYNITLLLKNGTACYFFDIDNEILSEFKHRFDIYQY